MELVWTRSLEWIGGTLERWGPELVDGWIALGSLRWILVGLVALLGALWIVLGIRRAMRLRHGPPPELLLTRGTLRFVDTPRDPVTGDRTDRFALRVALANLSERPVSIVELAILTEYAPDPVVIERVDALAPHGSVELTADVVGPAGDHGALEVYVTTPPRRPGGRPGLWRLEGTLSWEAWNARYRVEPLEQRVRPVRSLPSSRQAVQDRGTWRRQQEALRAEAERGGWEPASQPAASSAAAESAAASAAAVPTGGQPSNAAPTSDEPERTASAVREPAGASSAAGETAAEPVDSTAVDSTAAEFEPTDSKPADSKLTVAKPTVANPPDAGYTSSEPKNPGSTSPEPAAAAAAATSAAAAGRGEPSGAEPGPGDREPLDAGDLKLEADDLPPPVAALLADLRGAEGGTDDVVDAATDGATEDTAREGVPSPEEIADAHGTDEAGDGARDEARGETRDEAAEPPPGTGSDDAPPKDGDTYYLRERIDLARLSGPDESAAGGSASDELPADARQDDGASPERAPDDSDPGPGEAAAQGPEGDRHARDASTTRSDGADGGRGPDERPPANDAPRREPRPRLEFPDEF